MSRGVTNKGVDKFVEMTFDSRFRPLLFASAIATESADVQRTFFDVILNYLQIMAQQYSLGVDYFGMQDIASMSYKLYQKYLDEGGVGYIPTLDLNTFDS